MENPGAPVRLSLVVPCYNEAEVLPITGKRLRSLMQQLVAAGQIDARSQVLFVDDGSRDRTWDLIQQAAAADPMFGGLSLSRNYGHQYALLAGLHAAAGDAVISLDADLQDDVEAIPKMLAAFRAGFEVVYGVREDRSTDTWFKHFTASLFYRLMHGLGAPTVANHADYRLLSRKALEALRRFDETSLFLRGLVPLIGFRSTTVTYRRQRRAAGVTKYPLRKMLALSLAAITAHSNYPLRLITLAAALGSAATGLIALWVLYVRFAMPDRSVPGWTSTLLPVLFVGCMNLLATGIIGEYLARIYEEVKHRPRYLVADQVNLEPVERDAK